MVLSKKLAQVTTYYVGGVSTYTNINMRTVMGNEEFVLGAKYNLVLRAQMNDIANALTVAQSANRFLVSSNMMRFQNYETAVGKQASSLQMVTYASYPLFYADAATCNTQITNASCIHTFILESEVGFITVQTQNMINNTLEGIVYPNYLLIFDIYRCD